MANFILAHRLLVGDEPPIEAWVVLEAHRATLPIRPANDNHLELTERLYLVVTGQGKAAPYLPMQSFQGRSGQRRAALWDFRFCQCLTDSTPVVEVHTPPVGVASIAR